MRSWFGSRQGSLASAVLASFVLLSACSLFDPVPARQLDLTGTTWSVVAIDDRPVPQEPATTIGFPDGNPDLVMVTTSCRAVALEYALDTDGAALGFAAPSTSPEGCSRVEARLDSDLIFALAGVESWKVNTDDQIEMLGLHRIELKRLPDS